MTTVELNMRKLEFIKDFLEEDDDEIVLMQIDFFRSLKEPFEKIPGLAYTDEERIASVKRGLEQHRQGLGASQEEVFAKYGL
ncbi:MAG: hypothetical protein LBE91_11515 [Tannerella sp.]|jgi:hypothetical protein|nr:hypothetical protein [Tannerella sp.]